jgi:hypothetical protein
MENFFIQEHVITPFFKPLLIWLLKKELAKK